MLGRKSLSFIATVFVVIFKHALDATDVACFLLALVADDLAAAVAVLEPVAVQVELRAATNLTNLPTPRWRALTCELSRCAAAEHKP